jgi:hypothetical protein
MRSLRTLSLPGCTQQNECEASDSTNCAEELDILKIVRLVTTSQAKYQTHTL